MSCHPRKGKEAVDASQIRGAMGGETEKKRERFLLCCWW